MEMPQAPDENDGWVDVQEDEEEAQWNKLRQERDKFVEEKMVMKNYDLTIATTHFRKIYMFINIYLTRAQQSSSNEVENELCDSQIFKFGLEALKKVKHNELRERQDASPDKRDPSENMEPIVPWNLRDLLNGPNAGKKSQMIHVRLLPDNILCRIRDVY